MSLKSDSEILKDLEKLLKQAGESIEKATKSYEGMDPVHCAEECAEAQMRLQDALDYLLGLNNQYSY